MSRPSIRPIRPIRTGGLAAAVAVVVSVVSACGGGGNAYVGDDGEELAIGETASVEVDADTATGPLDVTLEGIETGDEADLAQLAQTNLSGTPYYLTFTLHNTDGSALAGYGFGGADLGLVNGLDAEGTAMSAVTTTDASFEPCPNPELPREFDEPGATQEVCVVVVGDGQEVVGANYVPGEVSTTTVWLP